MATNTITIGDVRLTRVGYADVEIDPARVGLTPAQVAGVPWAEPAWAAGDQVRAGAAAWVIDSGDARVVVDPLQAADEVLRTPQDAAAHQEAFAALLSAAGFPRESFTHAIGTHVEGVGMWAWRDDDGSWSPFFPDAQLAFGAVDVAALERDPVVLDPTGAMAQLRAAGAIVARDGDDARVGDAISVVHSGGHTPGHRIVRIDSAGEHAVIVGHLAVTALHLATGECPQQNREPAVAQAAIESLLAEDAVLVGPLWPAPGAGRWDGTRLVPVG